MYFWKLGNNDIFQKVSKTFEEYSHLWLEEGEDSPKEAVQDQEYSEVAGQNGYEEHWNLEPKKSPWVMI